MRLKSVSTAPTWHTKEQNNNTDPINKKKK